MLNAEMERKNSILTENSLLKYLLCHVHLILFWNIFISKGTQMSQMGKN